MFVLCQSAPEKDHMVEALRFELGKVERLPIRQRMVALLNLVDEDLAGRVAAGLGLPEIPPLDLPINHSIPGDADPDAVQPRAKRRKIVPSPALSMLNTVKDTVATRRIAILAADGVDMASVKQVKEAIERSGGAAKIVAPRLGTLTGGDDDAALIDFSLLTTSSVLFDAVYVPGGAASVAALAAERDAIEFVTEAYRHCKPIGATSEGTGFLRSCPGVLENETDPATGVLATSDAASPAFVERFATAIAAHRFWERVRKNRMDGSADETRGRGN
jgi:catalase